MDKYYRLSLKEVVICLAIYVGIITCLSYLFYDSVLGFAVMLPFFFLYLKYKKESYYRNYKEELDREFLKSLQSMTASLAAGFSPENAFVKTQKDMSKMFGNKSVIYKELAILNRQVSCGISIEEALNELAKRTDSKRIKEFALIFSVSNISGGDFTKVISSCVDIMNLANEVREEARVLIRGKQYEQRIMSVIPIGILLYLRMSSGSFISILYHNAVGIIVMTICLLVYIASIFISETIIRIEV